MPQWMGWKVDRERKQALRREEEARQNGIASNEKAKKEIQALKADIETLKAENQKLLEEKRDREYLERHKID